MFPRFRQSAIWKVVWLFCIHQRTLNAHAPTHNSRSIESFCCAKVKIETVTSQSTTEATSAEKCKWDEIHHRSCTLVALNSLIYNLQYRLCPWFMFHCHKNAASYDRAKETVTTYRAHRTWMSKRWSLNMIATRNYQTRRNYSHSEY